MEVTRRGYTTPCCHLTLDPGPKVLDQFHVLGPGDMGTVTPPYKSRATPYSSVGYHEVGERTRGHHSSVGSGTDLRNVLLRHRCYLSDTRKREHNDD